MPTTTTSVTLCETGKGHRCRESLWSRPAAGPGLASANRQPRVEAVNGAIHERRNGALAVLLAEQACEATDFQRAQYLDVLAAAYAETGRFEEAASTASKALAAASETRPAAAGMRTRLEGYLRRQPFRQSLTLPAPSSSSAP